jgi:glycosyltransferase involved in cell wall biosynthesis
MLIGPYGYSIVAKNLCKGLKEAGHNPWIISTLPTGNLIRDEYGTPNIPPKNDVYAKDCLRDYIKGLDIDCVITILDTWTPQSYEIPGIVHSMKIPIISHVTARSCPLSPMWSTFLENVDHIVAPTNWGQEIINDVFPERTSYIQHGVDMNKFRPNKDSREEMRKRLGYSDKFVFLAIGRNREAQKRYDRLFKAFQAFITSYPELKEKVVLHIHADAHENYNLEDLKNMGFFYLGKDLIKFSRAKWNGQKLELCNQNDTNAMPLNPNWGLDEEEMAKVYNMADCYITAAEAESFNMPCMEAQACGLPSIVPNSSVFPELVGKPETGIVCKIITEETTPMLTDVWLVDMVDMARAMHRMYYDTQTRELCSKNALQNSKKYDWKEAIKKWVFVIEKICEPRFDYKTKRLGF